MEEKERFELNDNDCIIDNEKDVAICDVCDVSESPKILVDLLNEQDKRIKELEETNKVLSNELTKNSILKKGYIETCCGIPIFGIPKIKEENQQFKQLLCLSDSNKVYEKYFELKQQLAEKDKEIEQLRKFDDLNKTFFNLFRTAFKEPDKVDDLFNTLKTIQEKQDQDKISFCIEQLEKVKNYMITDEKDMFGANYLMKSAYVLEFIDNQIKQLKEGK